jgi:hypothetical protein
LQALFSIEQEFFSFMEKEIARREKESGRAKVIGCVWL